MNLEQRIAVLSKLGNYILEDGEEWKAAKQKAERANAWFIQPFIDHASTAIAHEYLDEEKLRQFVGRYLLFDKPSQKNVGVVMAGNIPLVGFHDLLCVLLSGHRCVVKTSSKDEVLMKHVVSKLVEWEPSLQSQVTFAELLKGCDAYIATGSNNTARYFEFYFGKYPNIIRRNRTSAGVLTGDESSEELIQVSDAVNLYFGLGCRNITKLFIPHDYDFTPLLKAFDKYHYFIDHHKYKNNFDYQLAILLLDRKYYMTNGTVILTENASLFSAISEVHYQHYADRASLLNDLASNSDLQVLCGKDLSPFDTIQRPSLTDYADKVDTMEFLRNL